MTAGGGLDREEGFTLATTLEGIEPGLLWRYFARICSIPHCSGREAALRDDLIGLARERGWESRVDDVGNLVLSVPATPGAEGAATVVLQGHLDMVCEKNADTEHDFETQGVEPVVDGELVRARGTTLGADNGVGIAAGLAAASDPAVVHGPLELLCTIEEETGLTGATGIDPGLLRGRILLNLDTEEEGALYVGCAGGGDQIGRFDLPRTAPAVGDEPVEIKVAGLLGGHSGLDIHLGRGNALIVLARLLDQAAERKLISAVQTFSGGNMHNAIPREARAVVRVPGGCLPALVHLAGERLEAEREDLGEADPGLRIEVGPTAGGGDAVAVAEMERLVHLVMELPHGVTEMSEEIEGLVQTSNNIAVLEDTGDAFLLKTSTRSSVAANLERLRDHICSAIEAAGGTIAEREEAYPGWEPDMDSPVLARARRVHRETFGVEAEVKAIHAGLECGIIGEAVPGMDMVSLGPTIMSPHSPDERISIPSVQQFYRFLVALLADLAAA